MAQQQQESGLAILERNDPAQTKVTIQLCDHWDAAISRALQRNEWVNHLVLAVGGVDPADDYNLLCNAIETHGTLTRIWVLGPRTGNFPASASVVLGLLDGIRGNSNIKECALVGLDNAGPALCRYLDNAKFTPKKLFLICIRIRSADLVKVSNALQKNQNIGGIGLTDLPESHWLPIVSGLSSKVVPLRHLAMRGVPSKHLAIWQEMSKIRLSRKLSLQFAWFSGPDAAALVEMIPNFQAKILSVHIVCSDTDASNAKQQLLAALKRNFSFRRVSFKRSSYASAASFDMLNDADKELVQFYSNRNDSYAQWVENPTLLPEPLWPEAFALPAGPEPLFRSLKSVLPKVIEKYKQNRGKKRKHSDVDDDE